MADDRAYRTTADVREPHYNRPVISIESVRSDLHAPDPAPETSLGAGPIAEQVAALEREVAQLRAAQQSLRESNEALSLLSETARELLSSDRPQEAISILFQKLSALLGLEAYFNYMVDEERGKLHLNSYAGAPPEIAKEIEWLEYGQAVCGCVARDACRIVAEDVQNSLDVRTDLVRSLGITAYACHPLTAGGKIVGTFSFGTSRKAQFEPHELALMQAVCDQVSMALERSSLVSELRNRESEQRLLSDASACLASTLDYSAALADFARLMVQGISDWCVVDVSEDGGQVRRVVAVRGEPMGGSISSRLEGGDLLPRDEVDAIARVLRSGRTEFYPDLTDERMAEFAGHAREGRQLASIGVGSALVLPLSDRESMLGTVVMVMAGSGRRFVAADVQLAEELCRRAANAIETSRLYSHAREAVKIRDEFLSVAAHELKTPITSLRGFAQALLRQARKGGSLDSLRSQRALEVIDDQSIKLADLISHLLDVSRLDSGQLTLERRNIEIGELVKGIVDTLQMTFPDRTLNLRVHEPVWTSADPLRLEQVVRNLLDNAFKYSPADSRIDVDVWSPEIGLVKVAVRDRGPGIAVEHKERVFDQFYQIGSTSYAGGLGLGLYISRQIVEMHGGRIDVESPEDGGTRMVITLPTALAEVKQYFKEHNFKEHKGRIS